MIRTVVLIPVRDNEGRRFPRAAWTELEVRLLEFGGVTKAGEVEGAWRQGDRLYRDRSAQYVVSLGSWLQLEAWLDVVRWARQEFRQEALYVEVAGIPEIIAER